jgi:predicted metal-binding membrane protein
MTASPGSATTWRPGAALARTAPGVGEAVPARPPFAGVPAPILAAIGMAWAVAVAAEASGVAASLHHDSLLQGGPGFGPGLLLFLVAWQVMVAAMMLPSSLPLTRMYAAASARAPDRSRALAAFLGGYALVWSGFGAIAFAGDAALHGAIAASPWLSSHEWAVAPSVLLLAGAFQFTPLKDACLRACRHPASFLRRHYRRGVGGGFALGARHGLFCVGCCWALMLVMFAAGAASLVWMAALTALMVHEKTRPSGARIVPLTGTVLLAAGSTLMLWGAYAN